MVQKERIMQTDRAYVSGNLLKIWGFSEADLAHASEFFRATIHPDDLARIEKETREHLAGPEGRSVVEYRVRRPSGDYIWVPKEIERPFSYYMNIIGQTASIVSVAVSVVLLVIQINK